MGLCGVDFRRRCSVAVISNQKSSANVLIMGLKISVALTVFLSTFVGVMQCLLIFLRYCGVKSLTEYRSILLPLATLTQVQTTYFAQPYGRCFYL